MKLPVSPECLISPAKTDFVERARRRRLDRARPRLGRARPRGDLAARSSTRPGSSPGTTARATTARARRARPGSSSSRPGGSTSAARSRRATCRPTPRARASTPSPRASRARASPATASSRRCTWTGGACAGAPTRASQAGPVSLWGEFLETREERKGQGPTLEDLPEVRGDGWSATATWLVTGEKKTRTIRAAPLALRRARARSSSPPATSRCGSTTWRTRASSRPAAAPRNVRPAGYRAFTGGLSWWPSPFLRLMGDVVVERYDDALRAPEPGKKGNYVSLLGRVQVHLP